MTKQIASPHRHISFTAHYTGAIWHKLGWSHPALASPKGRRYVTLLHPLETVFESVVGGSMRSTLRQRHSLMDRQLDAFLQNHPDAQVLEIAAGLSPRGWRYRQKHPGLTFVEADLPDMAAAKRQALSQFESPLPRIESVDLFSQQLDTLLQSFDASKPLIILSEGLVNYFDKPMLTTLWTKLAQQLQRFRTGVYLTDIYPEPVKHRLATFIWNASKLLKLMSRSAFSFHFQSPSEAEQFFQAAGFKQVAVYQPGDDHNPAQREHTGALVWVIQAEA